MTEELISFKTASLAKEKGCNLDGYLSYTLDGQNSIFNHSSFYNPNKYPISCYNQSLLQKWLRDIHNIHIQICIYNPDYKNSIYRCKISYFNNNKLTNKYIGLGNYETCLEIGLQEALKLI